MDLPPTHEAEGVLEEAMELEAEDSNTDPTIEIPILPGASSFTLEVHEGDTSRLVSIGETPRVFGSSRRADVRLEDPTVSSCHCEISVAGDRLRVKDLGSRNGTFVGAARVFEAWAGLGTAITIGETQLVVHAHDEEVERLVTRGLGDPLPTLAGGSIVMRKLAARVRKLASLSSPVLVTGETGTGKELVASALHFEGRRRSQPFVPLNVAALPRDLVESELFGHERGAFTGAVNKRSGAFADAHRGTLFLDEIGELPLDAQPKLLRALDGYEIKRVGSNGGGDRADVRVIAATHKSLLDDVNAKRFRRDLFHRLEAFVVEIPPLRERRGDIAAIARRMLATHAGEIGERSLTAAAVARLAAHDWPGNVRELRNVLLRASESASDPVVLTDTCISRVIRRTSDAPVAEVTHDYADALYKKHGGNLAAAARAAGIPRTSFRKLLAK